MKYSVLHDYGVCTCVRVGLCYQPPHYYLLLALMVGLVTCHSGGVANAGSDCVVETR